MKGKIQTKSKNQSGATMLEFAVVFPVFIFFVIALIDLSRYIYLRALVNHWADDALSQAQILPGLDLETSSSNTLEENQLVVNLKAEAIKKVQDTSMQLATKGFFSSVKGEGYAWLDKPPELIFPTPDSTDNLEQTLRKKPLAVAIEATVKTFTPFAPDLKIRKKVSGYREIRKMTLLPVPAPQCSSPVMNLNSVTGQCNCPAGLLKTSDGKDCRCADPDRAYNGMQCLCKSPLTLTAPYYYGGYYGTTDPVNPPGNCTCPAGQTKGVDAFGNPTCSCSVYCSGSGIILDPVNCRCICQTGPTVVDGDGNLGCGTCPDGHNWNGSYCICVDSAYCPPYSEDNSSEYYSYSSESSSSSSSSSSESSESSVYWGPGGDTGGDSGGNSSSEDSSSGSSGGGYGGYGGDDDNAE